MTVLQGALLGIVQGVAEFLPISSSGHLRLVQHFFALDDIPLLFDVVLHVATLAAVILYFRKIIIRLFVVLFRWIFHKNEIENSYDVSIVIAPDEKTLELAPSDKVGRKTILYIILTTIVTGILGIASSKLIPDLSLKFVSAGFLVTACLLIISSFISRKHDILDSAEMQDNLFQVQDRGITWKQALIIGIAQGFGTLPGVSRSGSTIAGARLCGVSRKVAGDYSFLASIPAILGAFVLELRHLDEMSGAIGFLPMIAGCVCAFVFGYIALAIFMRIIRKGHLEWFAAYLIPLGIAGLIFL